LENEAEQQEQPTFDQMADLEDWQEQPESASYIHFDQLSTDQQKRLTTACLLLLDWIEQETARAEREGGAT
jgi:hypothetical protein